MNSVLRYKNARDTETPPYVYEYSTLQYVPEVVEGRGVLARGEVHHSEIIRYDPLEWSEVNGSF